LSANGGLYTSPERDTSVYGGQSNNDECSNIEYHLYYLVNSRAYAARDVKWEGTLLLRSELDI